MRKRRIKGEGSIYQTHYADGTPVWIADYSVRQPNGKRRRIRGHGATPQEALQRRKENYAKYQRNGGKKPTAKTIRDALNRWLSESETVPENITRVKRVIEAHFIQPEGNLKLSEVTPKIRERALETSEEAGASVPRNLYRSLSGVLTGAVRAQWIESSPLSAVRAPTWKPAVAENDRAYIGKRTGIFLSLLRKLEKENDYRSTRLWIQELGLRPGELCGLQWKDVKHIDNSSRATLIIGSTFVPTGHAHIEEGRTKNHETRGIPLRGDFLKAIRSWKKLWKEPAEEWARDQIFTTRRKDGSWHGTAENDFRDQWRELLRWYANIDTRRTAPISEEEFQESFYFRPHFSRHISASVLAETQPISTVSSMLGHLDPKITEIYIQTRNAAKVKAVEALNEAVRK